MESLCGVEDGRTIEEKRAFRVHMAEFLERNQFVGLEADQYRPSQISHHSVHSRLVSGTADGQPNSGKNSHEKGDLLRGASTVSDVKIILSEIYIFRRVTAFKCPHFYLRNPPSEIILLRMSRM